MEMAEILAVRISDRPDLLADLHLGRTFQYLPQMSVEGLNFGSVGECMRDDHDISPTRPRIGGKDDNSIRRRINRLATIGITAGILQYLAKVSV